MKLIKPSYTIIEQKPGLEGIYEQIELAGRTCYRSQRPEGKTAKDFVDMLIKNKHYAMLEHGTVYLIFSECCYSSSDKEFVDKYTRNPYSKVVCMGSDDDLVEKTSDKAIYSGDIWGTGVFGNTVYAITTNYRVLVENNWLDDLKYLCKPTEIHEKRSTVHFITSIGIGRELLRHRVFSFANESTRYCNYSKDKFNNELTFIIPSWLELPEAEYGTIDNPEEILFKTYDNVREKEIINCLICAEFRYFELLKAGCAPQQAREVLPLATKSELIMTGFTSDWEHLFKLRTSFIAETGKPHPDMAALCDPLYKEFIKKEYINEKF